MGNHHLSKMLSLARTCLKTCSGLSGELHGCSPSADFHPVSGRWCMIDIQEKLSSGMRNSWPHAFVRSAHPNLPTYLPCMKYCSYSMFKTTYQTWCLQLMPITQSKTLWDWTLSSAQDVADPRGLNETAGMANCFLGQLPPLPLVSPDTLFPSEQPFWWSEDLTSKLNFTVS